MFDSSIKAFLPPPPPDYQDYRQRLPSLPPPPPNAPNISLFPPSRTSNVPRYQPPPPPPPPPRSNDPPRPSHFGLPPPPPPPPPRSDHDTSRVSEGMFPVLPPPPPPPPLRPRSPIDSEDGNGGAEIPRQPQGWSVRPQGPQVIATLSKIHDGSTSGRKSHPSRRKRPRGRPRKRSSNRSSGSSTYSTTRPSLTPQSDSGSSSEEDPILYRNARQFPPLLPTAPAFGSPGTDSKASATKHITSWVTQYERAQSPLTEPPMEPKPTTPHRGLFDTVKNTTRGSDASVASSVSSEGEIEMLWTKLKEKRDKLNRMKTEMAKRRKELRDLRRRKDDADNAFMSVIRPMLISQRGAMHTPPNLLDRRLNDMQSLRTDYHFLEANYEGLEVMLDEEEVELNSLETRFFSLLAAGRTRLERPRADTDSELDQIDYFQSMPVDLKGISPDGPPEDLHPLYVELMSTVGDLENAKEDHEDLLFIKEQYDYDLEMKRPTEMGDEVAEFYAEFPAEQQRMMGNVNRLEVAVDRLKNECETQGVMRKHMSPRVEYLLYPEREFEDMDLEETEAILEQRLSLAHSKFPVLLTQPEHIMVPQTSLDALKAAATLPDNDPDKRVKMQLASKEYAIDRLIMDHETGGKTDFVNRWLLQQLRMSPMNAALLHSTFMSSRSLKINDFWRWQSDVLHYWWRDGTTALAEDSFKMVASESSQHASRIGTPQLSRAASDGIGVNWNRRHHYTNSSEAHTAIA
ncbi:hypothetical protein EDB80DRAFT_586386 [Ilyonectria destructans]|nr:hypothetical protein EDB80DRAFT_586386 [Ilyonectria destructans]